MKNFITLFTVYKFNKKQPSYITKLANCYIVMVICDNFRFIFSISDGFLLSDYEFLILDENTILVPTF